MASPLTHDSLSREATPSSSSSHGAAEMTSVSSVSVGGSSQEDVERFLKRMDMEKKMQTLQQRLELASVKATNGWTAMSIGEIENRLPSPQRKRASQTNLQPIASTSKVPYEPPSVNRPWQLIDVLWQPLPPPSHSRGPSSPTSPNKRTRMEEHIESQASGHRRSSSQVIGFPQSGDPRSSSPLRTVSQHKKRSQSHSHSSHHRPPTSQDVNAAKALASMLSGSPKVSLEASHSLPLPQTEYPPSRPRAASTSSPERLRKPQPILRTPSSHARRSRFDGSPLDEDGDGEVGETKKEQGEDDETAAELMMFLAHSPSPMKRISQSVRPVINTPARVLFADDTRVVHHSNLALAPPITRDEMEGTSAPAD